MSANAKICFLLIDSHKNSIDNSIGTNKLYENILYPKLRGPSKYTFGIKYNTLNKDNHIEHTIYGKETYKSFREILFIFLRANIYNKMNNDAKIK